VTVPLLTLRPIPAKTRLLATLREMQRIVEAMPDGVCEHLERSELLSSWRSQLGSIANLGPVALRAADAVRAARHVAEVVRQVRRR